MEDLLGFFNGNGVALKNPQLDGEFHRFGPNKNHWFWGVQNYSKQGEPYPIAVGGDWKAGTRFEYRTKVKLSREEMQANRVYMEKLNKKLKEEKQRRQAEAKEEIEALIKRSTTSIIPPHEYLKNKGIIDCKGLNILYDEGQNILVPLRDIDGEVWGAQRIYSDGNKRFFPGARVDGLYHVIGSEPSEEAMLCEGLSTGASIHMATGKPVICAMNKGNLVKVASQLVKSKPSLNITICADDDYKTDGNPGLTAANEAAEILGANVAVPSFKDKDDRGTDFNDLHNIEGLESVENAFKKKKPSKGRHYYHLGFDSKGHWFYLSRGKTIKRFGLKMTGDLYEIAPKSYWDSVYEGQAGRTRWEDAKSDLIGESNRIGVFDMSRVRGSGAWIDKGRFIINTGRDLIVDGEQMAFNELKSRFYYVQTKHSIENVSEDPLTVGDCKPLIQVTRLLRWETPSDAYLLCGWLAVARIAGALPVRPHVWVTGESGSGKSTVMNSIIEPCLGNPSGRLFVQGASTEAGIRQSIGSSSIPIMFDEFETDGRTSSDRVTAVLELLRQSWSQTGGKIYKGTAGGDSLEYSLNFAALVSSIVVNLPNQADRSRFSVLELSKYAENDHWDQIQRLLHFFDEEFGDQLFSRSCEQAHNIIKSYYILQKKIAGLDSQRLGQQVGILLAGYHSLVSDAPITSLEADKLLFEIDLDGARSEELSDQDELLNYIMTKRIRLYIMTDDHRREFSSEMTVEKAVACATTSSNNPHYYVDQLAQYGILIRDEYVHILSNHAELKKLLFGTKWESGWSRSLKRLPGAVANFATWDPGKKKAVKCTKIPLSSFM